MALNEVSRQNEPTTTEILLFLNTHIVAAACYCHGDPTRMAALRATNTLSTDASNAHKSTPRPCN